jgi:hypothetical protein
MNLTSKSIILAIEDGKCVFYVHVIYQLLQNWLWYAPRFENRLSLYWNNTVSISKYNIKQISEDKPRAIREVITFR